MPVPVGRLRRPNPRPDSLQYGSGGLFYMTAALGGTIMTFDPVTRAFVDYPIGSGALWPHTIRFDGDDIAWFTISISNQVGQFDPATNERCPEISV